MTVRATVTTRRMSLIKDLAENYESQLKGIVFRAINHVHNEVIAGLSKKGTGRIYKRGNIVHQASSAGNYPALDTGLLRKSIKKVMRNQGLQGFVETDHEYAKFLEFGTKDMAARPFMQPSLEKARPMVRKFLKQVKAKKG